MLACIIDCMKAVGLEDFRIELGVVDFFKGLMESAGIEQEVEYKLRQYIRIKNFFGLSEYVAGLNIPDRTKTAILSLDTLFGGPEMLDKAEKLVGNPRSLEAIDRMRKVYTAISYYGYQDYIGFDLSMINGYDYYTGIVFRGFTYGTGNPVVKGGRYNNLMSQFGKGAPSIGFAIYVDELMNALHRQKIEMKKSPAGTAVIYDIEDQEQAVKLAASLRSEGHNTDLIRRSKKHTLNEYEDYFRAKGYRAVYEVKGDTNNIINLDA